MFSALEGHSSVNAHPHASRGADRWGPECASRAGSNRNRADEMIEKEVPDPAKRFIEFGICVLVALMSVLIFGILMLFVARTKPRIIMQNDDSE